MHFSLYGETWQRGIAYADLLAHAREYRDIFARAEDSGCEGCYIEGARWNEQANRWERWCFEKVFGGEHPSERDDARVSSHATAEKFAAEINDASGRGNEPLVYHLPNYNSVPAVQ